MVQDICGRPTVCTSVRHYIQDDPGWRPYLDDYEYGAWADDAPASFCAGALGGTYYPPEPLRPETGLRQRLCAQREKECKDGKN
jgi:hypothetical protein